MIPIRVRSVSITTHPSAHFNLGDANDDGGIDISDAVAILGALFLGHAQLGCLDAANVNLDATVDLTDAVYLLGSLFLGNLPELPAPDCSRSTEPASLGCDFYDSCP